MKNGNDLTNAYNRAVHARNDVFDVVSEKSDLGLRDVDKALEGAIDALDRLAHEATKTKLRQDVALAKARIKLTEEKLAAYEKLEQDMADEKPE